MPFRLLTLTCVLLGFTGLAARSHAAEPSLAIPAERVCVPDDDVAQARLDPRLLVRFLLGWQPVSDATLDRDADGSTLLAEKRLALVDSGLCDAVGCPAEDRAALQTLRSATTAWVELEGGASFQFNRLRRPTIHERAADPPLDAAFDRSSGRFEVAEVLDPGGRFVEIGCLPPKPAPLVSDLTPAAGLERGWVRDPDHDEGFRLTSEIDDLSRTKAELSAVKPAEFSISSNRLEDKTTFSIDAIAGYHFDAGRGDDVYLLSAPFLLIERLFTSQDDQIDKLGVGWQGSARLPLAPSARQEFALTPLYLTDTDFETDIGTLKLRWTPTLEEDAGFPLGFYRQLGRVLLSTGVDLLVDAGNVFDSGDNPDLLAENRFLRPGGRLRLSLRGAEDTLFEQIQFDLVEKYLYNIGGDIQHINLIEVGFSYLFPDIENYRLSFSFTGGRDDVTLAERSLWKSQLGVRF